MLSCTIATADALLHGTIKRNTQYVTTNNSNSNNTTKHSNSNNNSNNNSNSAYNDA